MSKDKSRNESPKQPLHVSVQRAIDDFFHQLGDAPVTNLYDMVLAEVERPVIKTVLQQADFKQTKAAYILGLNRGTLRSKIRQYQLDTWIAQQKNNKE
ncbi:MAG: helix-turn-helix domain-containing protein [Pseudomonadota bacterium]